MDFVPPRILIVEDDPNDFLFFRRALGKLRPGTELGVVRDGDEAVHLLAGEGSYADRTRYPLPSHVVLDLKLPKKSGLEVLEWIRRQPALRILPVVVLTSSQESTDVERVRRVGVDRYCVKSATFSELMETIREILETWHLLP